MQAVTEFAKKGGPVLGICNGFQILQEAGLLPGAMLRNRTTKFLSQVVHVRVERDDTPATAGIARGTVLDHADRTRRGQLLPARSGRWTAWRATARSSSATRRPRARSTTSEPQRKRARDRGRVQRRRGNVVGLMPHPERASEAELGSSAGRLIFEAMKHALQHA